MLATMRTSEAARLMLATALLAPSSASEQHACTMDDACTVSCAACATCTTPSYRYDLAAYATPASGWLELDGATTTPAGNGSSGTAGAQFYYAVCPSATTGQWLDPEQIRCGPAPPAPYGTEGSNPELADPRHVCYSNVCASPWTGRRTNRTTRAIILTTTTRSGVGLG
jgi:hypothetical protein